jgi:hypothetical protein
MSNVNVVRLLLVILVLTLLGDLIRLDVNHQGIRSWLAPQPILSVVSLIIGFVLLSWQLDRQHRNALEANRRQAQDRLKLDLYDKIAERIEATSAPLTEVGLLPTAFVGELTVRLVVWSKHQEIPKSTRFPQLQTQQAAASRSIVALMSALETYAIVMPKFSVFRERLGEALRGLSSAVGDFHQAALPFAGSESAGPIRWPPTRDESQAVSGLADAVVRAFVNASAVVSDLRVEAQNYLLSGLFKRRVPLRAPGDPTVTVTTIASASKGKVTGSPPREH